MPIESKRRLVYGLAAFVATTALVVSGGLTASADELLGSDHAVQQVAEAVAAHPLAVEADILNTEVQPGGFVSSDQSATIVIPESSAGFIEVSPAGTWEGALTGLTIGLPASVQEGDSSLSHDGSVVTEGDGVQAVIQPLEGGLRVSMIIDGPNDASSFAYELPTDVDISLNEDGSASLSRSETVTDESGAQSLFTANIGQIGAAWATDANGRQVSTHYEVVGNQLVQVVDHGQPEVAYPVVADPSFWWGWNVYLSNTVVGQIVKVMLTGAGAAVLASRITALVPGIGTVTTNVIALAGAILAFGAAIMNQCNWNNKGVWVGHTWVTGVLPFLPTIIRNGYFCVPN